MSLRTTNRAYYRALGIRIAQLRKEREMTQAELARILGVSQQTVFAYELGDRRVVVALLPLLSETLDISIEELIGVTKPLRASKPRVSPQVMRYAERIQQFTVAEQRFILRLIDYASAWNKR